MDMTPQKLADWLQDKTIYLWDSGDEQYYASPICEDIVPMLRQQQAEIEALKTENSHLKYEISSGAWNSEELTDQEIFNIYAYQQDTYTGDNFPVAVGRAILKKASEK